MSIREYSSMVFSFSRKRTWSNKKFTIYIIFNCFYIFT
jgi:hypothetical protein